MKILNIIFYVFLFLLLLIIPNIGHSECDKETISSKLDDIIYVVYCEDRSNTKASLLVLSTIYNRANSYEIDDLHNEISKKNQYYCYTIKQKNNKINIKEYQKVSNLVCDFIYNKRRPITKAKYFYNYKTVINKKTLDFFHTLKVVLVHGSHVYLM